MGTVVAARHRSPLVYDVRDLWPESAAPLGELTNPRVLRAAECLERFIYLRSKLIVTANEAFSAYVRDLDPASVPVETVPNGTTADWIGAGDMDVKRAEVGLHKDRFVLAYAGNLGLAQSVGTAVEAMAALGDGFHLEIVGEGPRRAESKRVPRGAPAPRSPSGTWSSPPRRRGPSASPTPCWLPSARTRPCPRNSTTTARSAARSSRWRRGSSSALSWRRMWGCTCRLRPRGAGGRIAAAARRAGAAGGAGSSARAASPRRTCASQAARLAEMLVRL